jgi:hypothetical protein
MAFALSFFSFFLLARLMGSKAFSFHGETLSLTFGARGMTDAPTVKVYFIL